LIAAGMGWLIFYNYGGSLPAEHAAAPQRSPATDAVSHATGSPPVAMQNAEPVVSGDTSTLALAVPPPATDSANESTASRTPTKPADRIAAEKATAAAASAAGGQPDVSQPPRVEAPKPDGKPEPNTAEAAKSEPANSEAARKPVAPRTAQAEVKAAAAPPSTAVGKPQTAQWLRQQPAKYFTLQLFATTSRAKRDAFVDQQDHPDLFATFETTRNGERWYAVTYGVYATQAEAKSAAAALPASVGKVEPWVRTVASVQAAIE